MRRVGGLSRGMLTTRWYALPAHTVMVMPALSPTMESGSLESWTKKVFEKCFF
jgi:hypothetical protein